MYVINLFVRGFISSIKILTNLLVQLTMLLMPVAMELSLIIFICFLLISFTNINIANIPGGILFSQELLSAQHYVSSIMNKLQNKSSTMQPNIIKLISDPEQESEESHLFPDQKHDHDAKDPYLNY